MRVLIATMRWFGGFDEAIVNALRAEDVSVREVICRDYRLLGRHKLLDRLNHHGPELLQRGLLQVLAMDHELGQAKLLREAKRFSPDLLLVTDEDDVEHDTLHRIHRETGTATAVWIGDDPFAKPRLLQAVNEYDCLLVFDRFYVERLRPLTSAKVLYLPLGGDDSVFHESGLPHSKRRGTIHIGSRYPEREAILAAVAGEELEIYGWHRRNVTPELSNAVRARRVSRRSANRLYGRAAVVLSFHHRQVIHGSTRVFDPALAGAFQITEGTRDLGELLVPGKEVVVFESIDELKDKLVHYRNNAAAREQVAKAGHSRVVAEHTYRHRIRKLFQMVFGSKAIR